MVSLSRGGMGGNQAAPAVAWDCNASKATDRKGHNGWEGGRGRKINAGTGL